MTVNNIYSLCDSDHRLNPPPAFIIDLMKQENSIRKTTVLLILSLAIMLISTGCGSLLDFKNDDGSSAIPNNDEVITDTVLTDTGTINKDYVTLSWTAPSFNADGHQLAGDLAGYIIYYGQNSGNYTESVDIGNFTDASVSDLTIGTWCFTVTAYDAVGNESDFSEEICKTIS